MRTPAQTAGDDAEALVVARLRRQRWRILATQLHVGRAELDVLAVDPGPPANLVAVEVRWRRQREFGLPEETVDHRKLQRIHGCLYRLLDSGRLPDGRPLPRLPIRIDLVAVDLDGHGRVSMRHHRAIGG
jgi:Holliday junction resolvase-like predicted endonuclease